tara:strand:- start:1517 stop:2095 length:579 start_codon:yes stop_codon:yes gene_type:complete
MSLFKNQIIVWDTETTGLPRDQWAAVVDLGAVLVDTSGEIVSEFECLVLPDILDERADFALSISGLTPNVLRSEGLTVQGALERVGIWRRAAVPDVPSYHTAFNVGFDKPMMYRMGIDFQNWGPCIMKVAQAEMGRAGALPQFSNGAYKFPKLSEASEFYGVPMEEPAHRALADAKTAARIMVVIQKRRMGA